MSIVISFRLNPDNLREAQALEILKTKQAEGFSSRRVLTDALIGLVDIKERDTLSSIQEFNMALEQVSDLLERVSVVNHNDDDLGPIKPQHVTLNDNFLSSVKIAAKPGLNLE